MDALKDFLHLRKPPKPSEQAVTKSITSELTTEFINSFDQYQPEEGMISAKQIDVLSDHQTLKNRAVRYSDKQGNQFILVVIPDLEIKNKYFTGHGPEKWDPDSLAYVEEIPSTGGGMHSVRQATAEDMQKAIDFLDQLRQSK